MDTFNLIGIAVVALATGMFLLSVIGLALVVLFWKTRKIIIPKVTLLLLTGLEVPIKKLVGVFSLDGSFVDKMVAHMRNTLNRDAYASVPYNKRAVFMPQCLRHPDCPARLTVEGIKCVNCGRCGLGEIKKEVELVGMQFYIAPGSSLIKRMIIKNKPHAILGVGCSMEVKEGGVMMAAAGMPAQAVILSHDGCVDTRVDVRKVLDTVFLCKDQTKAHVLSEERMAGIASKWPAQRLAGDEEREAARQRYFDAEVGVFSARRVR
jgi:hypothetical protein